MRNEKNLKSYDSAESLQCGFDEASLKQYLYLKLKSADYNIKFIKEKLGGENGENIIEIGGGNGKLLYRLEQEGYVNKAINFEVSESRCKLAEKFKFTWKPMC